MRRDSDKWFGLAALVLVLLQVAVVVLSWLVTAAKPEAALRSLLSADGVRWFYGHVVSNCAQPLLVWLLMAAMTTGCLRQSRLLDALPFISGVRNYRQQFALRVVAVEAALFVLVFVLLTLVPHAILLDVTGRLWSTMMVYGLVPALCTVVTLLAVTYGVLSGSLSSLGSVFRSLTVGVAQWRRVWPLYFIAIELWFSLKYVLGGFY